MPTDELFVSLALALGVGLLLGFEREQAMAERGDRQSFLGGARTYPLVSMLGAVATLLSRPFGPVVFVMPFLGLISLLSIGYLDDVRRDRHRGITSEMAFLLAYSLGALAVAPDLVQPVGSRAIVVGSIATAATGLLSLKLELRTFVSRLSRQDVFAALKFLFVAVILLPQLPNEGVGRFVAVNPWLLGVVIVAIVGLSFAGYVAVRLVGPTKGLGFTGFFGGLVSSTAVTVSMARNVRHEAALNLVCAGAVQLATAVTFARILIEVWIVNAALIRRMSIPVGAMLVATVVVALLLLRQSRRKTELYHQLDLQNPVELTAAFKMALIFVVVLVATQLATEFFGRGALYATGLLAGTTNVDAITISMAKLARGSVPGDVAITTILLGAASNTVVKSALAFYFGGPAFGRLVLIPSLSILVLGGIVWGALLMMGGA